MEFRILGPLEVRAGTHDVALGGDKRRAVLAMLLLHANQPVSAERLAVALYGEEAAPEAVKTVRVHVSRIRAALGDPDALKTVPAGYVLRVGPGELDAERFEDLLLRGRRALAGGAAAEAAELLREGLELWRGDVLADLPYEAFAQAAITRLGELRWDAIEARNDAELALGNGDSVLAELERADTAPLRERLVEQRMRALYAAGRHVEALDVYREAQRRLDAELGLQPGPALRELERAVLAHDASLRPRTPTAPATTLVGRDQELEAVAGVIAERRLVTLTGPGGVGKTSLALEAARALAERFPGGVHVAHLARVVGAEEVPGALVRAVEIAVQPGEPDEEALARRLGGPDTLLLVDNVEHVLAAAPLISRLVDACPRLRVLATSREPLHLRAEQCLPVAPLAESDAIALFVDRARERRPDFGLTDDNAPAVAELCRRLDGLPLAIELAAGRVGLLEPDQLVERLADALPLLETGSRDAPERQRTITATLEWSFALLDAGEQQAFCRLSVFVGGADVGAAQAVADAPLNVLDALVAKSLVVAHRGRIRQLEVVRQFAASRLACSSEDDTRRRHAEHYLALAERLGPQMRVSDRPGLDQIEAELGNMRAALDHFVSAGDGERALLLTAALEPYWTATGRLGEGADLIDAALTVASGASARALGRARVARAVLLRGVRMHDSFADAEAALELCTAADDLEGRCMALDIVSAHTSYFSDHDQAQALALEERELAERLGDPYHVAVAVMRQGWCTPDYRPKQAFAREAIQLLRSAGHLRGIVEMTAAMVGAALEAGDYDGASEAAEEGLLAAEQTGEPVALVFGVGNAALAALFEERMDEAERLFQRQCEILWRERIAGLWVEPTVGLACVAAHAGEAERAAIFIGFGEAMPTVPEAEGDRQVRQRLLARFVAPARDALGERAWRKAAAVGARMGPGQLCDFMLERQVRDYLS